ncbi:MAG TPA: nitroreductase family deazaflavin-dependent oxidoreductase [Ktedonobacterales bacterium]|nr:nitroreductase family deazaflavin-dependent oxidoreductase [Ktedonobacterales bacterium]
MSQTSRFNDYNQQLIANYRANGGKLTGPFTGRKLLLLTTTGAKSGREHTAPVAYTHDGDRLVVIASKGGAPTNPAWYHNLAAHPEVTVELGAERFTARAVVSEGAERERLFAQMAEQMPNFAEYQRNTTRQLPVIVLERVAA